LRPDNAQQRYAAAALEAECLRVAQAPPGRRNDTLNSAAFRLGQLAGAGLLDPEEIVRSLEAAAIACRLVHDDGRAAVVKTIRSGLSAGQRAPRPVPKGNGRSPAARFATEASPENAALSGTETDPLDLELAALDLTDLGNAQRFVRRNRDRVRYCDTLGWLSWNGRCWSAEGGEQAARRAAHETIEALKREASILAATEDRSTEGD
jgi:hypothetical protein